MAQASLYRASFVKVIFRTIGVSTISLFLVWNPIVLRPRFWDTSVMVRSVTLDATLLVAGVGLCCSRKWAALVCTVILVWVAIGLGRASDPSGILLTMLLLTPLALFPVFWRVLEWGKSRDLLIVLGGVAVSALCQYVAFFMYRHPK